MFRFSKFLAIASLSLASVLVMASTPSFAVEKELGLLSNKVILYGYLGSKFAR